MDHIVDQEDTATGRSPDMKHLSKPRGKGFAFRMVTPEALIGQINPLTGRSFGREIKLGLGTRRHAEAVRLRDVHLGQIRQLEAETLRSKGQRGVGRIIDLSPENALTWIETRQSMKDTDAIDHVLLDELDKAAQNGHEDAAKSFAAIVFKGAVSLDKAVELYLEERSEGNPFGFDPLAKTTALNVRSTVKHLREFLGGEAPTLSDVTPTKAFTFRTQHLPVVLELKPQTVAKHMTLLRGLWAWAITDKRYLKTRSGKPAPNPWVI